MAIVRWEPFRDLVSIQDRMNRIFDEAFRGVPRAGAEEDWALGGTWAPAVDIYEQEGNLVLKAELPGIDPKDVDVRVENNVLTLRGERKFEPRSSARSTTAWSAPTAPSAARSRCRASSTPRTSRPSTRTGCSA